MHEYDPKIRVAECKDDDCSLLQSIEINFAIPCFMTQAQQRTIVKAMADIIEAPCNQPVEGCHWLGEIGERPNWSQADQEFMGKPVDADAPATGEPTFDDSVFTLGSCAREFVSDRERERKIKGREEKVMHDAKVKSKLHQQITRRIAAWANNAGLDRKFNISDFAIASQIMDRKLPWNECGDLNEYPSINELLDGVTSKV